MKAAVFVREGRLRLLDRSRPTVRNPADVLLRMTAVGICGTDLHSLQVPPAYPATEGVILGHEFSGEVLETGAVVSGFHPGEQFLVDPHPGCGRCLQCRSGHPDRCIPLFTAAALPLQRNVFRRLPLDGVHEGLDLLRSGQAIKVILHSEERL